MVYKGKATENSDIPEPVISAHPGCRYHIPVRLNTETVGLGGFRERRKYRHSIHPITLKNQT